MPIPDYYKDIIALLENKTAEENVRWNAKARGGGKEVSVSLEALSFGIWMGKTTENDDLVAISLYDQRGEMIDDFAVIEGDEDYYRLISLYKAARRVALGVEGAVQRLKASLSQEGPVGSDVQDDPF